MCWRVYHQHGYSVSCYMGTSKIVEIMGLLPNHRLKTFRTFVFLNVQGGFAAVHHCKALPFIWMQKDKYTLLNRSHRANNCKDRKQGVNVALIWHNMIMICVCSSHFIEPLLQSCFAGCARTCPNATPPIGKIHSICKIAVTFGPLMQFWYPLRCAKCLQHSLFLSGLSSSGI